MCLHQHELQQQKDLSTACSLFAMWVKKISTRTYYHFPAEIFRTLAWTDTDPAFSKKWCQNASSHTASTTFAMARSDPNNNKRKNSLPLYLSVERERELDVLNLMIIGKGSGWMPLRPGTPTPLETWDSFLPGPSHACNLQQLAIFG